MGIDALNQVWARWKVIDTLGEGSFGKVYKAVREEHGITSYAAIKVIEIPNNESELSSLRSEGMDNESIKNYYQEIVREFINEIKIMETMKGTPNIVSVEDFAVQEKRGGIGWDVFIRMELLTSFNEYIKDRKLSEAEVIKLGDDILSALELCRQRKIIHRDVKPENIFISSFGFFKLGDFGIARELEKTTGNMSKKGTYYYIAPEVITARYYDATVDTYSLGIVLYRLLNNNKLPFLDPYSKNKHYHEMQNALDRRLAGEPLPPPCDASEAMCRVILKACAFDPADRFRSATEFKDALAAVKASMPASSESIYEETGSEPAEHKPSDDGVDLAKPADTDIAAAPTELLTAKHAGGGTMKDEADKNRPLLEKEEKQPGIAASPAELIFKLLTEVKDFVIRKKVAACICLLLITGGIFFAVLSGRDGDVIEAEIPPASTPSIMREADEPPAPGETPTSTIDAENPLQDTEIETTHISSLPVTDIRMANAGLSEGLDYLAGIYNCVGVSLAAFDPQYGYSTYQYGYADIDEWRTVDAETKFRVAALSQVVVTILIMRFVEDGLLDLDEDIATYLGYPVRNPSYPDIPLTTRMLILHTSTINDTREYTSNPTNYGENEMWNYLNNPSSYRNDVPGEIHRYSNFEYIVLGAICERISGILLDTLAREVIFTPLGIDAAFVPSNLENKNISSQYNSNHETRLSAEELMQSGLPNVLGQNYNIAISNLTISTLDFAKILNTLAHGGTYDNIKILSEASVREMHNVSVASEQLYYMQGLSVRSMPGGIMGDIVYYHTGSAYGTMAQCIYNLETGRIAVVVTTGSNSGRGEYNKFMVCTEMMELVWQLQ